MKHYVYGLYTKNTDLPRLFYIGISSGDKNLYYREKNHRSDTYNPYKLSIIKKYDFDLHVIWITDSREEAEKREEFLIRWLGESITNLCKHSKDLSYARAKERKPKEQWKKHSKEAKRENRDRNLTVTYSEIIRLIEEWKQNPLETQQNFANRKNISRSKFKDWLRLYSPESIGLTKRYQREVFNQIDKSNKKPRDIINEFSSLTNYTYNQAKAIYYRLIKKH